MLRYDMILWYYTMIWCSHMMRHDMIYHVYTRMMYWYILRCTTLSNTVRTCDWRFCPMSCFIKFRLWLTFTYVTNSSIVLLFLSFMMYWLIIMHNYCIVFAFSAVWLCLCYFRVLPYRSLVLGDTASLYKMTWCPTTYPSTTDIQYCYVVIKLCSFTKRSDCSLTCR